MPGGGRTAGRVLVVSDWENADGESEDYLESLRVHNSQPDTTIAVFNSPFGPDVLVATDALSEGIDLHRCCRHLVHYELSPSPIRTVQRDGRLRRVNCWAAATKKPLRFSYPAYGGTRDHRLVQIMKRRIDSFSLLLGGVQDISIDGVNDEDERWRNEVLAGAKAKLEGHTRKLTV
jgi:superfamily II DNA/RNA helicase